MYIREAVPEDNDELQELQAKCPQGTTLITSVVNTPDFFARAKVYESYKVYVACEDNRIVGSTACAIRNALVSGTIRKVGHQFQLFTAPDSRRKGVASQLHQHREHYLTQQGVVLSYALIMEGNIPSMRYIERQGFRHHRTLVMPTLAVFKEMDVPSGGTIRSARPEDLAPIADLLNETWHGFELYEPTSADGLARFIKRTPAYTFDNLFVLENKGEILACLGFWDWSKVMRITVEALSVKMRMIGLLLAIARIFRPLPRFLKPGDTLKQMMLTPIGFKDPAHLAALLRHVNNLGLQRGIEQMFSVCERDHTLLKGMKGFIRIDTAMNLYTKILQEDVFPSNKPVFIDGIDL
jgi:GNAT superfamily N-acetyltransferase